MPRGRARAPAVPRHRHVADEFRLKRIIASEMVTVDGFFSGPNGELDWFVQDERAERECRPLEQSDVEQRVARAELARTKCAGPAASEDVLATPP
jgi:hypothetical protein